MGLIKNDGYTSEKLGITIPQAYARLISVSLDCNGNANAMFNIHQNREDTVEKSPVDQVYINTKVDKNLPIYEQIYIVAKEKIFGGWEDDIVTDIIEEVEEVEDIIEETVEE